MMFALVPAFTAPTVRTAVSVPATSRDTRVCSRMIVAAAMTTGSTVASGRDPCPPAPCSVTFIESDAAKAGPLRETERARGDRGDVLAEHHVRAWNPREEVVVDHRLRPAPGLLGGLEETDQRARPGVAARSTGARPRRAGR